MLKSMFLCNFTGSHEIKPCHKSTILLPNRQNPFDVACNQRLFHLNIISWRLQRNDKTKSKFAVSCSIPPGVPFPPGSPSGSSWKGLIIGIAITIVLPFLTNKWGPLLKFKNEVETVVETAEHVADALEKVAEQVEKVAEEIADDLPAGKLKDAATFLEHFAERTADDAELVGHFIDKVEEVEEKVENFVESFSDEETETSKEASVKDEAEEAKVEKITSHDS